MKKQPNIAKLKNISNNREYNIVRKNYKCYCIVCNRRAGIFHAYCGPLSEKKIKTWKSFRKTKWK